MFPLDSQGWLKEKFAEPWNGKQIWMQMNIHEKNGIFRWIAKKETNKMQDELKMGKRLYILSLRVQVWKNIQLLLPCANVKDLLQGRVWTFQQQGWVNDFEHRLWHQTNPETELSLSFTEYVTLWKFYSLEISLLNYKLGIKISILHIYLLFASCVGYSDNSSNCFGIGCK